MKQWGDWWNILAFIGNAILVFAGVGVVLLIKTICDWLR